MTLIDMFDTVKRLQISEKLLLDFSDQLKEDLAASEDGQLDEKKLEAAKEHAQALNS